MAVCDFDSTFPRAPVAADKPMAQYAGVAFDESGHPAMRHAWLVVVRMPFVRVGIAAVFLGLTWR